MNSIALKAYAGTIIRYGLVWVVAKFGLGSVIEDADIQEVADAVTVIALMAYGVWSKRKALSTYPTAVKSITLVLIPSLFLTGCAVIHGSAGDSSYSGWAFGEKASAALAGLNITETQSEGGNVVTERGVGVDKSGMEGQADVGDILTSIFMRGLKQSDAKPASTVSEDTLSDRVAPSSTSVNPVKAVAKKSKAKTSSVPKETAVASASVVAAKIAEAKSAGKTLVVLAGSPTCGFCKTLDDLIDADAAFLGRTDIILYRETAPWSQNGALAWTGGGAAPIVRVTTWVDGKIDCDKKLNRPQTVAAIEAAVSACVAP